MIAAIKAEFTKLLTVRSTYMVAAIILALVAFISFYAEGYKLTALQLADHNFLAGDVLGSMNDMVLGAIVAILLVTHEYRYNTIMYTLTSSNSRSRVLLAKALVISVYAVLIAAAVGLLSPLMSLLGLHVHGYTLVHQTINGGNLVWRSLFCAWGYGMAGFVIALLVRSQVAAIAILFLLPGLIEQLIGLLLRNQAMYLPFTALSQVVRSSPGDGGLAPGRAALVFTGYIVVSVTVAWVLLLRRDAN